MSERRRTHRIRELRILWINTRQCGRGVMNEISTKTHCSSFSEDSQAGAAGSSACLPGMGQILNAPLID